MPHPSAYNPERDITPAFLETVGQWIDESATSEIFVVLRYLRAAGAKDYALITSRTDFAALVACVPYGTDIVVFCDPQLPLRGKVTPEFLALAKAHLTDGEEYLFLRLSPGSDHPASDHPASDHPASDHPASDHPASDLRLFGRMGESHAELTSDWEDEVDQEVAFGPCPAFTDADHARMISASKGGIDGPR